MNHIEILGVAITLFSRREILDEVQRYLAATQQHQIVTVNPEFLVAAQHDNEFRAILNSASLAVADGTGVLFAAKLFGKTVARLPGIDLLWAICALAQKQNAPIFLLGAAEGVAARAAETLRKKFPRLRIVGAESGGQNVDPSVPSPVLTRIQAAQPSVLFVAFGHGKQERWIARHLAKLSSVKVAVGVGGSFDYLAQVVPRAPLEWRSLGLEWLYRLIRQPRRWKRIYRAIIVFSLLVLKQRIASLWKKR